MSRKKVEKRVIPPDPVYNDIRVQKFINHVMRRGKKTTAMKIVYDAFDLIRERLKKEPLEVFNLALENAAPAWEVKPKRIGGATYQVPIEVRGDRRETLAMRWIIQGAKQKKGSAMKNKLYQELVDASNSEGEAIKKKRNLRRLAEANKAFSHFAW